MGSPFDMANWVRCEVTDGEGFRCMKPPDHTDDHHFARCKWFDPSGARCMLPPNHPGRHDYFWFEQPARLGDTHTVRYGGTQTATAILADKASRVFGGHGWVQRSSDFEPGLLWRLSALTPVLELLGEPQGRAAIVFEYRPASTAPNADSHPA